MFIFFSLPLYRIEKFVSKLLKKQIISILSFWTIPTKGITWFSFIITLKPFTNTIFSSTETTLKMGPSETTKIIVFILFGNQFGL